MLCCSSYNRPLNPPGKGSCSSSSCPWLREMSLSSGEMQGHGFYAKPQPHSCTLGRAVPPPPKPLLSPRGMLHFPQASHGAAQPHYLNFGSFRLGASGSVRTRV